MIYIYVYPFIGNGPNWMTGEISWFQIKLSPAATHSSPIKLPTERAPDDVD
jgi:hypothetical protein